MNVCLIGNSLTNLVLAKILANKNIEVTIFYEPNRKNKFFSRTIGISKNNFDFFIGCHTVRFVIERTESFPSNLPLDIQKDDQERAPRPEKS